MTSPLHPAPTNAAILPAPPLRSPSCAPTPRHDPSRLARDLAVGQVLARDEGPRSLGSLRSLGGTCAGRRALDRPTDRTVAALLADRPGGLPVLVCANDGSHGLAYAAAARHAGAPARIYLHQDVPPARARQIETHGAQIVWDADRLGRRHPRRRGRPCR